MILSTLCYIKKEMHKHLLFCYALRRLSLRLVSWHYPLRILRFRQIYSRHLDS